MSIWSTPGSAEFHARQIKRNIDRCPHDQDDQDDQDRN
jgi:hypothetical protein